VVVVLVDVVVVVAVVIVTVVAGVFATTCSGVVTCFNASFHIYNFLAETNMAVQCENFHTFLTLS